MTAAFDLLFCNMFDNIQPSVVSVFQSRDLYATYLECLSQALFEGSSGLSDTLQRISTALLEADSKNELVLPL